MKNLSLVLILLLTSALSIHAEPVAEITIAEYGEFLLYTPLYIADELKLFEQQGIKVKIIPAGGDEKVFAALVGGSAQFGVGDPTFVAISGEKGRPGKVIYSLLQNIPAWGVAIDSKIKAVKEIKELKDYTIATYPAPSTSYALQSKIYQIANLEPKIIQITYGALIPALLAKRVDIILEYEPNVSLAIEKGAHKVYSISDYFPEFALTGLTALPEYLERNPEITKKVILALKLATEELFLNRDKAVEILAKRFPEYSPKIIDSALKNAFDCNAFSKDGVVTQKGWDEAIRLRKELGDLKQDAPYKDYVVTKFLETNASLN